MVSKVEREQAAIAAAENDLAERKKRLAELKKEKHAILFIDEIHTIIGAGSIGVGREQFEGIIGLVADGSLKMAVDKTWPLEQAAEALGIRARTRIYGRRSRRWVL